MIEEVLQRPGFWALEGPHDETVLSSRIRLARNMSSVPFPNRLDQGDLSLLRMVIDRFVTESEYRESAVLIDLRGTGSQEKRLLRERNVITSEMEESDISMVIACPDYDFTILVNEEDHFRIQVIRRGLRLREIFRIADSIDDELNRFVQYAFSDQYGYLCACPSNIGTGLKVSVLLHLPALAHKKRIGDLSKQFVKSGLEIKGTVGDMARTMGGIYHLSNRVTLGMSEVDIIETVDCAVNEILTMEDRERDELYSSSRNDLEDRVMRSLGLLLNARKINYVEAMDHISNVRLGVILAIIRDCDINTLNEIMVNIQWSHLQRYYNRTFRSSAEADEYRSVYIRSNFH